MATVRFTRHLQRFFSALKDTAQVEAPASTVAEVLAALDARYPGFASYVVDDHGALRKHVNIFVNNAPIKEKPASLSYIWIVAPGPDEQPNRRYMGTEPGGLFQSDDGGQSWGLVESLWNHPSRLEHWFGGGRDYAGIDSVIIDPRDSKHLFVAVSCGGMFESHDEGATWQARNKGLVAEFLPDLNAEVGHDPHFMVMCKSQPDALWQQNHCGIFRSTDGAKTWQEVSQPDVPARFGFAIAVDPDDANTAWVVPAISDEVRVAVGGAMCVSRTTDGGETWTALRKGLPQKKRYDVTFRHALDLRGDSLAFCTTTGNVFVSDDRGDTWQCIGHHFPPVNSVRFA